MIKNSVLGGSLLKTLLLLLFTQLTACSDDSPLSGKTTQPAEVSSSNAVLQPAASTDQPATATPTANTGTVISVQNSGGYSYIEIDINGATFWMAASLSAVKPGERVGWNDYAMMKNFTSKSINRTFDQIMFVNKVVPTSASATNSHTGSVLETVNSAGYSYILVEEQGKQIWLAVPATDIKVGQSISWNSGAAMRNFASQTLNRTFDEIYFVNAVQVNQS